MSTATPASAAPEPPFSITTATAICGSSYGAKHTNVPFAMSVPTCAEPVLAPQVTMQRENWEESVLFATPYMPFFTACSVLSLMETVFSGPSS